jgi:hypothetical protein
VPGRRTAVLLPLGATLSNANYDIEACNFASIKAEGNGGNDIGDLYGKAANNALAADNVFAQFSGDGFSDCGRGMCRDREMSKVQKVK